MTVAQIQYGKDKEKGNPVYILDAKNGLNCGCVCFDCGEELEAVQGKERQWHFRHTSNIGCRGGQESALHKLAKEIIYSSTQIALRGLVLAYSAPEREFIIGSFRSDITVISTEGPVHFEIRVTRPVPDHKIQFYKKGRHSSIEIDLSNVSYSVSPQVLEQIVIHEVNNKEFIYWPPVTPPTRQSWWDKYLQKVKGEYILLIFLMLILFWKRKKISKYFFPK